MSAFGKSGLTKEPGAKYSVDLVGFATYDVVYSGILTGGVPFMQGDAAAEHPTTVLLSMSVTETGIACNHVKIELHYEGKDVEFTRAEISQDVSVDFTTSQEPVESHPDFTKKIGGTPTDPLHGAYYDRTTGEFLGFPVVDPDEEGVTPSRFAGVRSYLMPQETFSSNSIEFDYPTPQEIDKIGKVFSPVVKLPVLPGERTWINTGIRVQNVANVYFRTQKTGMLSGPRKWIPEIYGTA